MSGFRYNGSTLAVARHADIPCYFRAGGMLARYVQIVLDKTEPWDEGDNPIETERFVARIYPMAVRVRQQPVVWGVHVGHKARKPQLSPFAIDDSLLGSDLLGYLTLELEGSGDNPLLTRVYGGRYTPPLPWMTSAGDADGGREACRLYWRNHAYLDRRGTLIKKGTRTTTPPSWRLA